MFERLRPEVLRHQEAEQTAGQTAPKRPNSKCFPIDRPTDRPTQCDVKTLRRAHSPGHAVGDRKYGESLWSANEARVDRGGGSGGGASGDKDELADVGTAPAKDDGTPAEDEGTPAKEVSSAELMSAFAAAAARVGRGRAG